MIEVREERPSDQAAVHRLNTVAFRDDAEADIVDKLRATCDGYLAFVAIDHGAVVGHILFTPVTLEGSSRGGMGLAPMAVDPSHQRHGIGSLLVRHGLDHLRASGCPFVIVLGHPDYYPRFGFERASRYKISSQWEGVPDEAFMVVVFDQGAIPAVGGIARYRSEFDAAM
jgi:putative acetyltransferase